MRTIGVWGAVALTLASAAGIAAADLSSGIAVGGQIGAYSTVKCGGIDDGVELDKALCYT
jgi:hypothetical protein